MFKGFKDFLLRGNVVELAVAVVMGKAFSDIVTAFVDKIINPLIASIGGKNAAHGLGFRVLPSNPATFIDLGFVIGAIINFILIGAVVYFVLVMPFEKMKSFTGRAIEEESDTLTDNQLLTEIRDLLATGRSVGTTSPPTVSFESSGGQHSR